jgi:cell division septal protein FtsQ
MAERTPDRRPRARSAVVPLPGAGDGLRVLRALPSGRSLAIGFAIVAAAVGLYALARFSPMFSVQRIEVVGAPPDVAAHVRSALAPLEGTSLLELNGSAVQRALAPLTDVSTASYDRAFPHTLRVIVRPETPVAVARRGAEAWLVSSGARVISSVPLGTQRALPRIWLGGSADPQAGAALTDRPAVRAVRALARADRSRFAPRILFVRFREHDLTFVLSSGLELRLGDLRAVRLKLAVASQVLPQLLENGGYAYLDVSVPGRPVAGANPQASG